MPRPFDVPQTDSHAGLCYEAAAPVGLSDGRIKDSDKRIWLGAITAIRTPAGYAAWFKHRWRHWLERECFVLECVTAGRLLVGSGNASGSDVGLHLHHTWGVPMVPGSALKGVLSHYLDAVYGPDPAHDAISPVAANHPDPDRARFRRPGRKPATPPGDWQRIICGSADYDDISAAAGHVVFHDMLLMPPEGRDGDAGMLDQDVLTPHHSGYHTGGGVASDFEDPTPVPFLAVPPGTRFLLAVGGQRAWAEFAIRRLAEAVANWGVGAKTAAGYGRLEPVGEPREPSKPAVLSAAARSLKDEATAWLDAKRPATETLAAWEGLVEGFCREFSDRLRAVSDEQERTRVLQLMRSAIAATKLSKREKEALRDKLVVP